MNEDKATKRPWEMQMDVKFILVHDIYDGADKRLGAVPIHTKANAELILRAVNCHDELVEACEFLLGQINEVGMDVIGGPLEKEFLAARAILAKAKEST